MIKDITVEATPRQTRGKNEARRLRQRGFVPAVVYGGGKDAVPVAVNSRQVAQILHSPTGHNTIFQVAVGGSSEAAMLADWQIDPLKGDLLHTDLKRIDLTRPIQVKVPIATHGDAKGVKTQGGLLEVVAREVEIESLPADIPEHVVVDVTALALHQAIRVKDLVAGERYRFSGDPDKVVVHVVPLKKEEAKAAAEAVEGEAAVAAPAEPEVIKKGKKEEEGAGEEKEQKGKK
jgi:large subunit ribosomal protein L25